MKALNPLAARLHSRLRHPRVPAFPHSFIIETTSRCNLACRICPHCDMRRPAQDMAPTLFRSLIDQIAPHDAEAHVQFIALHWFGEPLLHPQFIELAQYAGERLPNLLGYGRERKAVRGLTVSTNATLLDEQAARALLASPLTWLAVSVDGSSPDTYESLRGGSFAQVVANVELLLRLNRESRRELPTIAVQIVSTAATRAEFEQARQHWQELAGDAPNVRVELKPYTDWAGQVQAPELCAPDVRRAFWYTNCGRLWDTLVIGAGGEIGLCCYDVEAGHDLGDARETALADLWRTLQMEALRRKHATGRVSDLALCANCAMGRKYPADHLRRGD
ncbi:MAG: radical SAM protein [Armatimonadota bacterium]